MGVAALGLKNELHLASASNANFANALSEALDIGTPISDTATVSDFIFPLDYVPTDAAGETFPITGGGLADNLEKAIYLGIVADSEVDVSVVRLKETSAGAGTYSEQGGNFASYFDHSGVSIAPAQFIVAGVSFGLRVTNLTAESGLRHGLRISVSKPANSPPGDIILRRLWVGTVLRLPRQWQSGSIGIGSRRWEVRSSKSESGISGRFISRPTPGRLSVSMPVVPNDWITKYWYPALKFTASNPFWALMDADPLRQPGGAREDEVNYCWPSDSPPQLALSPSGHSTISLKAATYPDFG